MSKVTVLGGCGAVGSIAVETLARQDLFHEVVIGDLDLDKARQLISRLGSPKISAVYVNAFEPETIRQALAGADVVLNCIGPFY
jgi:saccharopine dehydrogenase (NAD+, L-lysine-forming)